MEYSERKPRSDVIINTVYLHAEILFKNYLQLSYY